jgi:hypothetical protein
MSRIQVVWLMVPTDAAPIGRPRLAQVQTAPGGTPGGIPEPTGDVTADIVPDIAHRARIPTP